MADSSSDSEDDCLPALTEQNGGKQDAGEDEGEEMYVDGLSRALDLFSSKTFQTAEECVEHCRSGWCDFPA